MTEKNLEKFEKSAENVVLYNEIYQAVCFSDRTAKILPESYYLLHPNAPIPSPSLPVFVENFQYAY